MDKLLELWKNFVIKMNDQGIPLPMVRANGKASVTATLVVMSSFLMGTAILIMIGTVLTKLTGVFTITEANETQLMNAFNAALQMHIAALGAYLGRGFQRGPDGKLNVDKSNNETEQK